MIGQLLTGRYLILKTLGAGGFSETYLARDKYLPHHPLCVVKCLKLSPNSAISPETAKRLFATEARILDLLGQNHAQIPTLFAYCHEDDQSYVVQEYIDGENLANWVTQGRRLSGEGAVALLSDILSILNYIHSQRVIHRDIKPSNLIRRKDGKIVLIDFGAACFLPEQNISTQPESDDTPLAIGTPGYMPDEQHLGMSQLNSDLYALGMLVIHMVTGVHPRTFQQDLISGELDWQAYVDGQTIDPQLVEVLNRMVRSHPRDRYTSASEALTAVRAIAVTQRSAAAPKSKRNWFVPQQHSLLKKTLRVATALVVIGTLAGGYVYGRSKPGIALLTQMQVLPNQANVHLTLLHDLSIPFQIERMIVSPDNHHLVTAGTDGVLRVWSLDSGTMLREMAGHNSKVTALSISQNGQLLVSGAADQTIHLWDVASGQLLGTFQSQGQAITAVAISADMKTIASGNQDGTIQLWDLQTGALAQTLSTPDAAVTAVTYGETPTQLITASSDRSVRVWDLQTGKLHRIFAGHSAPVMGLQVVDGDTLLSFGEDRTMVWNLKDEALMQVCSQDSGEPVTASLNNQHMVIVDAKGNVRLWARRAGKLAMQGLTELGRNLDVVLSPNHHYLVSWSLNQRLQVWQMNTDLQ